MKKNLFRLTAPPIVIVMLTLSCLLPKISQAQYTKLLDFAGTTNGRSPHGTLMFDGTFLYGMTNNGGTSTNCTNGCGTIFKIKPDGTGFVKILDFNSTNGANPLGFLISDGTFLYGMTNYGGTNNSGVLFKIKPDGTGFAKLLDFGTNGAYPTGSLIFDGTFLYGLTNLGGAYGRGTMYKIKPDGSNYSKLLDFGSVAIDGTNPYGALIFDGTFLYGMTLGGGTSANCAGTGCGTIFKIKPDGTNYAKLFDFTRGNTDGASPHGDLIFDGTFLYGMNDQGGTSDDGIVFKIKPDGTGFIKLIDFSSTNGILGYGSLISDGTFLYGMRGFGGTNNDGVIFKIKPDGTDFLKLLDFTGTANGANPYGSLIFAGNTLYGMTSVGGINDYGTIFGYHDCTVPLTIASTAIYDGSIWSTNVYTTITIGTGTSITATTDQVFKFSNTTTIVGPFSSGTTSKTLGIVPTPCP